MLAEQFDGLPPVAGLRDQFHVGLIPDERGDAFAQ